MLLKQLLMVLGAVLLSAQSSFAAAPHIHFAIVCASVSCPDLNNLPYTAARLDAKLDGQVRRFFGNAGKGFAVTGKRIRISKIFDWFEEDFLGVGSADAFVRRYRSELPTLPLKADITYDRALNGTGSDG